MSIKELFLPKIKLIASSNYTLDDICLQAELYCKRITSQTRLLIQADQIALVLIQQQICAIIENGCFPLDCILDQKQLEHLSSLDIFFFTRKTFSDQRWGTPSPLLIVNANGEKISLRAHGTFSYCVDNPKIVWRYMPTQGNRFSTQDIIGQLRSETLNVFSEYMSLPQHNLSHLLKQRDHLTQEIMQRLTDKFNSYGLKITSFLIQHISVPENASAGAFV